MDINADLSGDVTDKFIEYTQQINRELLGVVYKNIEFLRNVPDEVIDDLAAYPESTICTEQVPNSKTLRKKMDTYRDNGNSINSYSFDILRSPGLCGKPSRLLQEIVASFFD